MGSLHVAFTEEGRGGMEVGDLIFLKILEPSTEEWKRTHPALETTVLSGCPDFTAQGPHPSQRITVTGADNPTRDSVVPVAAPPPNPTADVPGNRGS